MERDRAHREGGEALKRDPYLIERPALLSLSGGRSSGFMLDRILRAYGGVLPPDIHVTFANTGKEKPATLNFVQQIGREWRVPIRWLEFRYVGGEHTYAEVDYATAARKGEPFETLIALKKYLPNPVTRYCTSELKIRVMKKYMLAQGFEEWDSVIGFRADEPARVHRAKLSCARERYTNVCPMAVAGHTLADVMAFWSGHSFDLQLRPHEGNCDLCFLKGAAKIERLMIDEPESADWWIVQEKVIGGTFREDRPPYAALLKVLQEQGRFGFDSMEYDACGCTD